MRNSGEGGYCLRRRIVFAVLHGGMGTIAGLCFFAPVEQVPLAPVYGALILLGTGLFTINWLVIARTCVGSTGITRTDWLGLYRREIPFHALSRIDLGTRPSVPMSARVVEFETSEGMFVLDRRTYGDQGVKQLLCAIREYHPDVTLTTSLTDYIDSKVHDLR
jgi:hypothetical protein